MTFLKKIEKGHIVHQMTHVQLSLLINESVYKLDELRLDHFKSVPKLN